MPLRDTVKVAQKRLAELDADHRRSLAKLDRAQSRRTDVIVDQDRRVALAQADVDGVVAAMAAEIGAELTATLVGRNVKEVRRVVKSLAAADVRSTQVARPSSASPSGSSPPAASVKHRVERPT